MYNEHVVWFRNRTIVEMAASWYGIEQDQPVLVCDCISNENWTTLRFGWDACCRVRTADITVESYDSFRKKSNQDLFVPVPLTNGTLTDILLDPAQSFFRHSDEASFWERITADSLDNSARSEYADWLHDHNDPHAWVFREPTPFAAGSVRFDWTEAMARVNCGAAERRPTLWEFAHRFRRDNLVPFTLADDSPLPLFVAYLLDITRIRANQCFFEQDQRLLAVPVCALGLSLKTNLLFDSHNQLICRITDPLRTVDYLGQVRDQSPNSMMNELVAQLREINCLAPETPTNEAAACAEICRRLQSWRTCGVTPRKHALLAANYFSTYRAGHYESFPGQELIHWVVASSEKPLTTEERELAAQCANRAPRRASREQINRYPIHRHRELQPPASILRTALFDPLTAVNEFRGLAFGNTLMAEIMECLQPADWEPLAPNWTPPPEAVRWARRIHEEGAFSELPILADLLEDYECPDRPLLDHCRHHDCHYRGCAALDRILGIEQRELAPHLRLLGQNELAGRVWWFSEPFEIGRLSRLFRSSIHGGSVSRRHAVISHDATGWRITDRGSTNGTWLNGTRLGAGCTEPLRTTDMIQFGSVAFRVVFATPPSAAMCPQVTPNDKTTS